MIAEDFAVRWFQHAGFSPEEARRRAELAAQRVPRYSPPVPWGYVLAIFLVEWFFPLLFLRRWSRASRLDASRFDELENRLHQHPWLVVRLLYTLVRLPIWESLAPEKQPSFDFVHPLTEKISKPEGEEKFDYIVVGSGPGGAPLAWSLSRAGFKVAVIESGSLAEPSTTAAALERYYLKQAMTLSIGGGLMPVLAGDTVGGTTPINSGTCLRPLREKLEQWDRTLGTEFAEGMLDPYLDQVEEAFGVTVPPKSLLGRSALIFENGLTALGREGAYVLPRAAKDCVGSGRCCFVCPSGAKFGTDRAFLPEAIDAGCTLFAQSRVTSIREDAQGVRIQVRHGGREYRFKADGLVLSAGAFGTPALIRKNRLGSHWRRAGAHLRTHPAAKVYAYMPDSVNGEEGVPQGMGYRPPELPRVVMEGIFTPKAGSPVMVSSSGRRLNWWLDRYENLASFGVMLIERSEGKLFNFFSWPVIRYRMVPEDVRDLSAAILLMGKVFFAAGAKRVLLPLVGMKNEYDSIEELDAIKAEDLALNHLISSGFHPQGTAAMGTVVDRHLALKGTRRIHVCDASVLPASPGVNPQITVMALSLYLADRLKSGR
ncbi:MAG: GMC family oxidoreductase [Deltaproteobacteria bacterium]|nr:GMC family oxidoreductase [Deltaproteobacteria bacterium]